MTYLYKVYEVTNNGIKGKLIAEGNTEEFGEKITNRTKEEQKEHLKTVYGYGKSYYLKAVNGYPIRP